MSAMMVEYDLLRQESLAAIGYRLSILSFTFAALAVLTAGLLQRKVSDVLAGAVALSFVPQLAKAGLLVWLGEHARSQRAGRHLVGLEARVNAEFEHTVLSWETSLAGRRAEPGGDPDRSLHLRYPYVAVVVLLLGTGWTSEALGVYLLSSGLTTVLTTPETAAVAVASSAVAVGAEIAFLRFFASRWRAARQS